MAGEQAAYAETATALTSHALRMVTVPVEEACPGTHRQYFYLSFYPVVLLATHHRVFIALHDIGHLRWKATKGA
jgi:hypothetical protein